jgi:hypothetical protein
MWATAQFLHQGGRVSGPFLDFNSFGALIYLALLPAVAWFCGAQRSIAKWLLGIGIGLGFFSLFGTASRSATAVVLFALPAMYLYRKRAKLPVTSTAMTICALALGAYAFVKLYPDNMLWRTLDLAHDPSSQYRLMIWRSAWHAWLDHPILGTGLGTFRFQYLHYRLPEENNTSGDLAHNDYLQILMESGPMGLIFILGWGCLCCWLIHRIWRASAAAVSIQQREENTVTFAMTLAVSALFLHALVNFIFYVAPLALVAGLYLGRAHAAMAVAPPRSYELPLRGWVGRTAFATLTALMSAALFTDWAASQILGSPPRWLACSLASPEQRYRVASAFSAIRPNNVMAQQTLTMSATEIALQLQASPAGLEWAGLAVESGKRWLETSVDNPFVYTHLAQLLRHYPALSSNIAPLPDSPEALLVAAIARYPAFPQNYVLLAQRLSERGEAGRALELLWTALPWINIPVTDPAIAEAWEVLVRMGSKIGHQLQPERSSLQEEMADTFDRLLGSTSWNRPSQ